MIGSGPVWWQVQHVALNRKRTNVFSRTISVPTYAESSPAAKSHHEAFVRQEEVNQRPPLLRPAEPHEGVAPVISISSILRRFLTRPAGPV